MTPLQKAVAASVVTSYTLSGTPVDAAKIEAEVVSNPDKYKEPTQVFLAGLQSLAENVSPQMMKASKEVYAKGHALPYGTDEGNVFAAMVTLVLTTGGGEL